MRIGIDATALPSKLFGAGNYIINLVQALAQIDARNEYIVFAKPEHIGLFDSSHTQVVSAASSVRVLRILWEQSILPFLARQYRIDVLHSPHYTVPFAVPCATVVTFHDMTFFLYPALHQAYKRLFFRTIIPLAANRANMMIAASASTRQDILRLLRVSADCVVSVAYGVAPLFRREINVEVMADVRHKYNLPPDFILYVGNLEPRKNLPTLVRSFAQIVAKGLPHDLVFTGTRGWQDSPIFKTIQELKLTSRVHFTGYVPREELPALFSACAVFVYPSIYEGFGLPILEAMACGAPVITSNVSSMPEVAGDAGILIDPHNSDALTDALVRVLTDAELRDTLARKGLARSKLFSWERTAQETLAVYERAFRNR